MSSGRRWYWLSLAMVQVGSLAFAAEIATVQRMESPSGAVIDVVPKSGPGIEAPVASTMEEGVQPTAAFAWTLQLQNDAVFTDLSMADATHGFASAELGRVYRTVNGQTWTAVMNIGFPRYWYGVHAFDPSTAFVSGFQNQSGAGIGRWTTDGGTTWTDDLVIDPANWLTMVQFADRQHGIATAIGSGWTYYTTNGGAAASDWTRVLADPTQGWFAGNFTFQPTSLRAYVTGISFCTSSDAGASYARRPSIDSVFDGGTSFPDAQHGWTGGGQISSPVQGWVHRTTDAGFNWSGRILNPPYPIRALLFLDAATGFAVGGNYFGAAGGIWSTTDGGTSWNLDLDTGCEMKGIDWARVNADSVAVWAAGSRSGVGRIYRTKLAFPASATAVGDAPHASITALYAAPNPTRGESTIAFELARPASLSIEIFDASGRRVRTFAFGSLSAGRHQAAWDGHDDRGAALPAGVYYAVSPSFAGKGASLVLVR